MIEATNMVCITEAEKLFSLSEKYGGVKSFRIQKIIAARVSYSQGLILASSLRKSAETDNWIIVLVDDCLGFLLLMITIPAMVVRTEWRFRQQSPQLRSQQGQPVSSHSRWIIGFLTAVYLFWLLVRVAGQPDWLQKLPSILSEFIHLVEFGWLTTLLLLWGVIWWRARQEERRPFLPLTLEQLYNLHPAEFERYVARLFRQKKYKVTVRGRSGDLGVDLVVTRPGGKRAIVQCKRYRNTIGPDIVRELYGTLIHEGVAHAFLVTTAEISDSARIWAEGKPMTLIDGQTLVAIASSLQVSPSLPQISP